MSVNYNFLLTNKNVTVSGDGFVKHEGATYNVVGSQTEVGESEFIFIIYYLIYWRGLNESVDL